MGTAGGFDEEYCGQMMVLKPDIVRVKGMSAVTSLQDREKVTKIRFDGPRAAPASSHMDNAKTSGAAWAVCMATTITSYLTLELRKTSRHWCSYRQNWRQE
ncbi:hypothetical protein TNCV_1113951 [Trichonephila clavipes]|nr:hypothetical protein TNCV_1113951 [Trichonephila clavipes]